MYFKGGHMNNRLIIFGSLFILFFCGCEQSTSPSGGGTGNSLTLTFQPTYIIGTGTVVLHNEKGDSVISIKKVTADGVVQFTGLASDRVSFTMIDEYLDGSKPNVTLRTNVGVKMGEMVMKAFTYDPNSTKYIRITATIPTVTSPTTIFSLSGSSSIYTSSSVSSATFKNRYFDENGKVTILYALISRSVGGSGYCNWSLDQQFVGSDTLKINFDSLKTMNATSVTLSRAATQLIYYGLRGSRLMSSMMCFYNETSPFTSKTVFYNSSFPGQRWQLSVSGPGNSASEGYGYSVISNSSVPPSSLTIPTGSLTCNYDTAGRKFTNIVVLGSADELYATWGTYSSAAKYIRWYVYKEPSATEVVQPYLNDSLRSALGINSAVITTKNLYVYDYDKAVNYDALIDMVYRNSAYMAALYDQFYYYYVIK
jgi:hypothetical protein